MQPRTEAMIGVATITLLGAIAAVIGNSRRVTTDPDVRPSTFLAGPLGSRALLEATRGMGVEVRRFRQRSLMLPGKSDTARRLLVMLDPSAPISAPELENFTEFSRRADLILAGKGSEHLMRCFGYRVERRLLDSVEVMGMEGRAPKVNAYLVPTHDTIWSDTTRRADAGVSSCTIPRMANVTPLLVSARGLVAVRLERGDNHHQIVLVSDAALFRNRAMRESAAGTFALGLIDNHYDQVLFEEYHHGYGASGSLTDATIAWSWSSPWGWAVWQLSAVGLLALLFGATRFGPVVPGIVRTRRSPLEHVRALATALSAAKGHDEAIGAMVRGLRRRLAPPALRARGDWRGWLNQLDRRATSPAQRTAIDTLQEFTKPGQPSSSVLHAANAVEDVWENIQS